MQDSKFLPRVTLRLERKSAYSAILSGFVFDGEVRIIVASCCDTKSWELIVFTKSGFYKMSYNLSSKEFSGDMPKGLEQVKNILPAVVKFDLQNPDITKGSVGTFRELWGQYVLDTSCKEGVKKISETFDELYGLGEDGYMPFYTYYCRYKSTGFPLSDEDDILHKPKEIIPSPFCEQIVLKFPNPDFENEISFSNEDLVTQGNCKPVYSD